MNSDEDYKTNDEKTPVAQVEIPIPQTLPRFPRTFLRSIENADPDPIHRILNESFETFDGCRRNENVKIKPMRIDPHFELMDTPYFDIFPRCPICLDIFEPFDDCIVLTCNHFYHEHCITEWTKYSPICPYCRHAVPYSIAQSSGYSI